MILGSSAIFANAFTFAPSLSSLPFPSGFRPLSSSRYGRHGRMNSVRHRDFSMAVSWIDSPAEGQARVSGVVQPKEGGDIWDRNAWLEGWRSGEEVQSYHESES